MLSIEHLQQPSPPLIEDVDPTVQIFRPQVLTRVELMTVQEGDQRGTNHVSFQGAGLRLEPRSGKVRVHWHTKDKQEQPKWEDHNTYF